MSSVLHKAKRRHALAARRDNATPRHLRRAIPTKALAHSFQAQIDRAQWDGHLVAPPLAPNVVAGSSVEGGAGEVVAGGGAAAAEVEWTEADLKVLK